MNKQTQNIDNALDYGKLPPQAIDLEEAVIGAVMIEKDALFMIHEIIKPECFYKPSHQMIYQAAIDLSNRYEPIDTLTITEELRKKEELDIVGGPFYITQLASKVSSAAHIEYHARIILSKIHVP
jgi:replicative DNA helicase